MGECNEFSFLQSSFARPRLWVHWSDLFSKEIGAIIAKGLGGCLCRDGNFKIVTSIQSS